MEITTTTTDQTHRRKAATSALAVVGFITLIIIGIALAIYSARYIPVALDRLGLAAVFESTYEEADEPDVEIVESVIPFEPIATSTATTSVPAGNTGSTGSTGGTTGGTRAPVTGPTRTVTVPVTVPAPKPYGLPDLTVDITAVGYCSSNRPDSFRRADEIPDDENGGIKFTVRNAGTNVSGKWSFTYELPTSPSLERDVDNQRSLNPGDRMEFTLCFTEPRAGSNRTVAVRVDDDRDISESNENNNRDTATIDIEK